MTKEVMLTKPKLSCIRRRGRPVMTCYPEKRCRP